MNSQCDCKNCIIIFLLTTSYKDSGNFFKFDENGIRSKGSNEDFQEHLKKYPCKGPLSSI